MDMWMLRTFDQAGYYETRLILMTLSLLVACFFAFFKHDRRFLVMFFSGAALQTAAEIILQYGGFRGDHYGLSIFGLQLPGQVRPVYQGLSEGGTIAVFAFWFAKLRTTRAGVWGWLPFAFFSICVLALSFVVGSIGSGERITSQRPIFFPQFIMAVTAVIFLSLWISWRKNAVPALANFFAGLLIFAVLNYEPLHYMGVRFIGSQINGHLTYASSAAQVGIMTLSNIFEASGGKLHYLILPLVLGWVQLSDWSRRKPKGKYTTEQLQKLAERGWHT
jgi:hypothetical protein